MSPKPHYTAKAAPKETERGPDWRDDAACLGTEPETYFPPNSDAEWIADAKAVCQPCPVRDACLEWALTTGQHHGVWGGLTENERAALLKKRDRERSALRKRQARAQKRRAS